MIEFFMEGWKKCKSEENLCKINDVKEFLFDEESRRVFNTRIKVYESGDLSLMKTIQSQNSQYFDHDILRFSDQEFFVDLGAYKGDTLSSFFNLVKGNYRRVVAFEPDHENMLCLNRYILENNLNNIIVYKLASWDSKTILKFHEDASYVSQIYEYGTSSTHTDSLDNVLFDEFPATFIKMDVEGAECNTITGAEKIIKKHKPKLAICVYHRASHLFEIPKMIKELVPEYKIYLRHYSDNLLDTVLYATL